MPNIDSFIASVALLAPQCRLGHRISIARVFLVFTSLKIPERPTIYKHS